MSDGGDPGHTLRFTDRAGDYARFRPGYPKEAIDTILAGLDTARIVAADIGAGTGISARAVAERGVRVIAIEPNAAMREAAAPHPHVEWRAGTAEATGLPAGSVHLLICAQAFHWFDPGRALAEFQRILRRGGRLAITWNKRDHEDALTAGYREAIRAVGGETPAEAFEFDPAILTSKGRFTTPRRIDARHRQSLSLDGLIGRAMSASHVPKSGPGHEELLRKLRALHARHADPAGVVTLVYVAQVFLAERS